MDNDTLDTSVKHKAIAGISAPNLTVL